MLSQLKGGVSLCSSGRGVAIGDGDRHGGVVLDRNSYGNLRSLVYHGRGTARKISSFRTIVIDKHNLNVSNNSD